MDNNEQTTREKIIDRLLILMLKTPWNISSCSGFIQLDNGEEITELAKIIFKEYGANDWGILRKSILQLRDSEYAKSKTVDLDFDTFISLSRTCPKIDLHWLARHTKITADEYIENIKILKEYYKDFLIANPILEEDKDAIKLVGSLEGLDISKKQERLKTNRNYHCLYGKSYTIDDIVNFPGAFKFDFILEKINSCSKEDVKRIDEQLAISDSVLDGVLWDLSYAWRSISVQLIEHESLTLFRENLTNKYMSQLAGWAKPAINTFSLEEMIELIKNKSLSTLAGYVDFPSGILGDSKPRLIFKALFKNNNNALIEKFYKTIYETLMMSETGKNINKFFGDEKFKEIIALYLAECPLIDNSYFPSIKDILMKIFVYSVKHNIVDIDVRKMFNLIANSISSWGKHKYEI